MRNTKLLTVFCVAVGLLGILLNPPAMSAEESKVKPIELRFASFYSPLHPYSVVDSAWMKKIEKESNGRVHFTPYWAGSLISPREAHAEIVRGVADLGNGGEGYAPKGFPIVKKQAPFYYGVKNFEVAIRAYNEVRAKFPEMDSEFADVKVLMVTSPTPYQFQTTKPVRRIKDISGLVIKIEPAYMETFKQLGVKPVSIPMPEVYVNLEKGIIDGMLAPYETLKSFKFAEVVKSVISVDWLDAPWPKVVMNLDSWSSLPPDIQKIFDDSLAWWGLAAHKQLQDVDKAAIDYARELGVEFIDLPEEDLGQLAKAVEKASLSQAAELDALGLPGAEIYKETRRLIEKYGR